jgi:hypothetical protein
VLANSGGCPPSLGGRRRVFIRSTIYMQA